MPNEEVPSRKPHVGEPPTKGDEFFEELRDGAQAFWGHKPKNDNIGCASGEAGEAD